MGTEVAVASCSQSPPHEAAIGLGALAALAAVVGVAYMVSKIPSEGVGAGAGAVAVDNFARMCFLPVCGAAIVFSFLGIWATDWAEARSWRACVLVGVVTHVLGILLGFFLKWRRDALSPAEVLAPRALFLWAALASSGALGCVLVGRFMSYAGAQGQHSAHDVLLYATGCVPLVLGCFWVEMSLLAALSRIVTREGDREWWARASGWFLLFAIAWASLFGLILYGVPASINALGEAIPGGSQLTLGGLVLGAFTSAMGYWSKNGEKISQRARGLWARLGVSLLNVLAGVVLLLILLAMSVFVSWLTENAYPKLCDGCRQDLHAQAEFVRQEARLEPAATFPAETHEHWTRSPDASAYVTVLFGGDLKTEAIAVALFVGVSLLFAYAMGANAFSLHGMYGNRLVRAYLGASREDRSPDPFTGFDPLDNLPLSRFVEVSRGQALFPVLNMALNLVRPSGRRLAWQQRKAASFTATPLHCGNNITGYAPTSGYGGPSGFTIGRAMTISGAAASPNMGYHSSSLVTLVMALFNVRLGWWSTNPSRQYRSKWPKREPPRGALSVFAEAFGLTTDNRASVYLSDGGHFENLGLYEMVRRRCHRILLVDAACDPDYQYADLHDAVRKIRVDFGIRIDVPRILPGQPGAGEHRMAVAIIHYSDRDEGKAEDIDGSLYIIKPLLNGSEPPDVANYARVVASRKEHFPQQSTTDQFFDETQFESYRALGLQSLRDALVDGWPPHLPDATLHAAGVAAAVERTNAQEAGAGALAEPILLPTAGLAGLMQGIGPGAALASALMVGGTFGAIGTVQLSSNEVRWSAEDRALLRGGVPLQTQGASVPLDIGSQTLHGTVTVDGQGKLTLEKVPDVRLTLHGTPTVPLTLGPDDLKLLKESSGNLAIAMNSANGAADKLSKLKIMVWDGKEAIPVTVSVPELPLKDIARLITNRPQSAPAASATAASASLPDRNELVDDLGKIGAAQTGETR
jgi:hypothetical protein